MRQRFTDQVRRALILAHQEARMRGHDSDGTRRPRDRRSSCAARPGRSSLRRFESPAGLHTNRPTRSTGRLAGQLVSEGQFEIARRRAER